MCKRTPGHADTNIGVNILNNEYQHILSLFTCPPYICSEWLNLPSSLSTIFLGSEISKKRNDGSLYSGNPSISNPSSRRGRSATYFPRQWPTDDHAVCIFPFRRYEVRGMILYAKSSLELIVNNRIGKVGIRPDCRGHPKPPGTLVRCAAPPPRAQTLRGAAHLISYWSQRVADLLLSVRPSVRSVGPIVGMHRGHTVRPCVYTYAWPSRHFRPGYERIYTCRAARTYNATQLRIITYKRVILSYTPALLMIIKTPRSILFALEYFLKFSLDNGAIRAPSSPFSSSFALTLCLAFAFNGETRVLGLHAALWGWETGFPRSLLLLYARGDRMNRARVDTGFFLIYRFCFVCVTLTILIFLSPYETGSQIFCWNYRLVEI